MAKRLDWSHLKRPVARAQPIGTEISVKDGAKDAAWLQRGRSESRWFNPEWLAERAAAHAPKQKTEAEKKRTKYQKFVKRKFAKSQSKK